MARKIIWSHIAKIRLYSILEFYAKRNGNKKYSVKLYKVFIKEIKLLVKHPELGFKSSVENIRGLIIQNFIIFYESKNDQIIIHTIWQTNQNPVNLLL
jgi:plasmid stabilization system protein ParE